jgi:hypothetical protein
MTPRHPMNRKGCKRGSGPHLHGLPASTHPITGSGRMRNLHRMTSRHPMNRKGCKRGSGPGNTPVWAACPDSSDHGKWSNEKPSSHDSPSSDESKGL